MSDYFFHLQGVSYSSNLINSIFTGCFSMFRSKREIDRHVESLEHSISSESERALKALSIAKSYYNVKEFQLALKYVNIYINNRPNSATALKCLGQIQEALNDKDLAIKVTKITIFLA